MVIENGEKIISRASPHTIKKFDLIEKYVETWAQKLLNTAYCSGIVFIDCMCNSGLYYDDVGNRVEGTPIRVSKILRDAAGQYPKKKIYVYLNDYSPCKIKALKDGSFDIERFKEFLSDKVAVTNEGYELKFLGKNYARLTKSVISMLQSFISHDRYTIAIDRDKETILA